MYVYGWEDGGDIYQSWNDGSFLETSISGNPEGALQLLGMDVMAVL